MTIRIYNPVKQNYSYAPVFTNVRTVNQTEVILDNGTVFGKKLAAKVEILSVMDAPEDYDEAKAFWNSLGVDLTRLNKKMKAHEFDNLDLPKYI